jgi:hypothetical protein
MFQNSLFQHRSSIDSFDSFCNHKLNSENPFDDDNFDLADRYIKTNY